MTEKLIDKASSKMPILVKHEFPLEYQIDDAIATGAIITIQLPALLFKEVKSGSVGSTSVALQIGVTPAGATETIVASDTISGKCSSTYERSYTIALPTGGNPWTVKIHRMTPDSTTADMINALYVASVDTLTGPMLSKAA
jgi:predicted phage tail protein